MVTVYPLIKIGNFRPLSPTPKGREGCDPIGWNKEISAGGVQLQKLSVQTYHLIIYSLGHLTHNFITYNSLPVSII